MKICDLFIGSYLPIAMFNFRIMSPWFPFQKIQIVARHTSRSSALKPRSSIDFFSILFRKGSLSRSLFGGVDFFDCATVLAGLCFEFAYSPFFLGCKFLGSSDCLGLGFLVAFYFGFMMCLDSAKTLFVSLAVAGFFTSLVEVFFVCLTIFFFFTLLIITNSLTQQLN